MFAKHRIQHKYLALKVCTFFTRPCLTQGRQLDHARKLTTMKLTIIFGVDAGVIWGFLQAGLRMPLFCGALCTKVAECMHIYVGLVAR